MASPERFAVVRRMLEGHGWSLHRTKGSHHTFKRADGAIFTVPVHGGMVKPVYVKKAKKLCGEK